MSSLKSNLFLSLFELKAQRILESEMIRLKLFSKISLKQTLDFSDDYVGIPPEMFAKLLKQS